MNVEEQATHKTHWTIRRFADDAAFAANLPYDVSEIDGNLLLNGGIGDMLDLFIAAAAPTAYDNTNARIGVGDSTTAAAAGQTDLQAATNKTYKGMEASYPSRAGQTITFRAVFGSSDANYAWQEFVVDNSTTAINRKVSSQGTKASGQTWTVDVSITIS